jgi:hypothetical protein
VVAKCGAELEAWCAEGEGGEVGELLPRGPFTITRLGYLRLVSLTYIDFG